MARNAAAAAAAVPRHIFNCILSTIVVVLSRPRPTAPAPAPCNNNQNSIWNGIQSDIARRWREWGGFGPIPRQIIMACIFYPVSQHVRLIRVHHTYTQHSTVVLHTLNDVPESLLSSYGAQRRHWCHLCMSFEWLLLCDVSVKIGRSLCARSMPLLDCCWVYDVMCAVCASRLFYYFNGISYVNW